MENPDWKNVQQNVQHAAWRCARRRNFAGVVMQNKSLIAEAEFARLGLQSGPSYGRPELFTRFNRDFVYRSLAAPPSPTRCEI
jgi:hypothetical protein